MAEIQTVKKQEQERRFRRNDLVIWQGQETYVIGILVTTEGEWVKILVTSPTDSELFKSTKAEEIAVRPENLTFAGFKPGNRIKLCRQFHPDLYGVVLAVTAKKVRIKVKVLGKEVVKLVDANELAFD